MQMVFPMKSKKGKASYTLGPKLLPYEHTACLLDLRSEIEASHTKKHELKSASKMVIEVLPVFFKKCKALRQLTLKVI